MKTYFITDGTAIKIGKSSKGGMSRLKEGTMNPRVLELIGEIDGDYETTLHNKFAPYKLRGEWFKPTKELLIEISNLCGKSVADFPAIQEPNTPISVPTKTPNGKHPCLIECDYAFVPHAHQGVDVEHEFYEWWIRYFVDTNCEAEDAWFCLTEALDEKIRGGATKEKAHEMLSREGWEYCSDDDDMPECTRCIYSNIGLCLGYNEVLERIDAIGVVGLGDVIVYLDSRLAEYKDSRLHKTLGQIAWRLDEEYVCLQISYVDATNNQVTERFAPYMLALERTHSNNISA